MSLPRSSTASITSAILDPAKSLAPFVAAFIASNAVYKINHERNLTQHNGTNTTYALVSSAVNVTTLVPASVESLIFLALCYHLFNREKMMCMGTMIFAGLVLTAASLFYFNREEEIFSSGILASLAIAIFNIANRIMKLQIETVKTPAPVNVQALQNMADEESSDERNENTSLNPDHDANFFSINHRC
jgi:hypothetical protein